MPHRAMVRRALGVALCLCFVLEPASVLAAGTHVTSKPSPGRSTKVPVPAVKAAAHGGTAIALPPAVSAILRGSGLPAKSFALDVRSVDGADAPPLLAFNADQSFLLGSTTKLVTSLAALDLLGPQHRWRTTAYSTGPVVGSRLNGDLVIVGGPVGLTGNELRRWFAQMRGEGLQTIAGNIDTAYARRWACRACVLPRSSAPASDRARAAARHRRERAEEHGQRHFATIALKEFSHG